ncbi:MAG TPA: hemolysin family protein [Dehalococcoidia bacterium]|nr:hemolysin family protein [Dehalococcoidia bacterium]
MYVSPLLFKNPLALSTQEESIQFTGIAVEIAIAILIISVLTYALVNSIEIAVVGANRIRIRHLAEEGNKAAVALLRLQQGQERFFALIVLLQNLSVILASTMGSILAADSIGGVGGLIAGTGVMTFLLALLGEVTPKVLAAHAGERYPLLVARPTHLLMVALRPLVTGMAAAPGLLSRLIFGSKEGATSTVTEAELRMLIDIGAAEGAVAETEAELLESVFHFGDRRANEIMVPRTEIVWLEHDVTIGDFFRVYSQKPHTRFPVFQESVDNVVGIVNIKDILRGLARGEIAEDSPISWAMRPALFAPETKQVGALFSEMQRTGHQMAVIIDEFGGTAGLLTLEMLLEELVGYVSDELSRHAEEFVSLDERTFRVDAGMSIHDANQELELGLPEGDYETVAGFVLEQLGHIPAEGEQFTYDGFKFQVSQMAGRKIEAVTITRLPESSEPEG